MNARQEAEQGGVPGMGCTEQYWKEFAGKLIVADEGKY
tara:strand:- start:87038 stop:87151 length:114 start_codon:yes stop_codon:yes gene_type:complete